VSNSKVAETATTFRTEKGFAGLSQLAFFGRKEKRQEKVDSSANSLSATYIDRWSKCPHIQVSSSEVNGQLGAAKHRCPYKTSLKVSYKYILAR